MTLKRGHGGGNESWFDGFDVLDGSPLPFRGCFIEVEHLEGGTKGPALKHKDGVVNVDGGWLPSSPDHRDNFLPFIRSLNVGRETCQ